MRHIASFAMEIDKSKPFNEALDPHVFCAFRPAWNRKPHEWRTMCLRNALLLAIFKS